MEAVSGVPAAEPWTFIDLAFAIGLGLSLLLGLWRGLVAEVLSLLGWVVAYVAAQWLGPTVSMSVPVGELGSRTNVIAGMVVTFVAAMLVWALISWGVIRLVRQSVMSAPDRLLGAVFGVCRGVLMAFVVVTLVSMTPMAEAQTWQTSRSVAWLQVGLQGIQPWLPEQVQPFLPAQP